MILNNKDATRSYKQLYLLVNATNCVISGDHSQILLVHIDTNYFGKSSTQTHTSISDKPAKISKDAKFEHKQRISALFRLNIVILDSSRLNYKLYDNKIRIDVSFVLDRCMRQLDGIPYLPQSFP